MGVKSEGNKDKNLKHKKIFERPMSQERKITMMNNTTNTTKTATSTKKFAFTYDHVNQKIVGKDVDFQKAGIPGSKLEAELQARMDARPNYTFTVIETAKKPAKQSYEGLNRPMIEQYLEFKGNKTLLAEYAQMKEEKVSFPTVKSWFLDNYKRFDVKKAKAEMAKGKLEAKKDKVRTAVRKKIVKSEGNKAPMELVSNF